ncbi:MAG: hypothetical protein A2Y98_02955 [Candidatus Portnoybacteria bacterium RBG_19FT_COMBO_36_7]|uniref:Glycosyltransferase subfamily 4-like N-terminal domain-containing protein n=1 Tax=Candidatus Portnoybacteria bacterium RBG_19FT_COMBO_36_7 TaxID=1801992 RepID=A0A1G2F7K7_9BACT|nr:MAG: hypothetical protein A2Y98_02955 [Candidatus Portnoybacteria bacterium RBG_19FT_COMBO_36_7]
MENKDLKVLCLSFWTPPIVRPQSILIGKMIPEWVRQGINPVILTYDICGDWQIDLPIYKIPQFKINKYLNKLKLATILEYFYYRKLLRTAKKIIEEYQINLIFSFSNPQASNILGAMINKKLGIKFISHFSDPWFDNPFKSFSWLGAKKVLAQEKYIIKHSARVIFITETMKEQVMRKYPQKWQDSARVISHCYDLKDYPDIENKSGKYIISYVGAFYGKRNPKILFQALRKLLDVDRLKDKFKFRIIGGAVDYIAYKENLQELIKDHGLEHVIELISQVDYKKSLEYMKTSDCLVVIDADYQNSPFLTSKVVDYAGSGRAIIGITPENSPTAEFLKKLGYWSFSYNQIDELADHLNKLILGEIKPQIDKDFLGQFNITNTTAKLINQFKEVLGEI